MFLEFSMWELPCSIFGLNFHAWRWNQQMPISEVGSRFANSIDDWLLQLAATQSFENGFQIVTSSPCRDDHLLLYQQDWTSGNAKIYILYATKNMNNNRNSSSKHPFNNFGSIAIFEKNATLQTQQKSKNLIYVIIKIHIGCGSQQSSFEPADSL